LDFEFGTINYQENIYKVNPETGEEEYLDPSLVTVDDLTIQRLLNDEEAQGLILEVNNDSAGLFVNYKLEIAKVVVFYILEYKSDEAAELFVNESLATGLYRDNSLLQFGKFVFLGHVPGYEFQGEKQEIGPNILAAVAALSPTGYVPGEGVAPTSFTNPNTLDEVLTILEEGALIPLPGTEVEKSEISGFLEITGADEAKKVTFKMGRRNLAVYMAKFGYVQDGYQMYIQAVRNGAYDNNDLQINGTLLLWFTLPFPEYNSGLYDLFPRNHDVDEFWETL
jgi:hypothetical protein